MISIIIPTLNRKKSLNLTLESLAVQNFPLDQFEILIVDNGSTDGTKSASEKIRSQHPEHQIRYIYEPEPGLLSGRHRGALEAQGDILTFVDDDIEADVNWLQAIQESFGESTVQLVGGRNLPKYEVEPPEWLQWFWTECDQGCYCSSLSLLDLGDQVLKIDANYIWGLNFSIRKKALFELGGFHPDCLPQNLQHFQGDGETGLTRKAKERGYQAIYQPRALVYHQVSKERMTPAYFDKRYFYQGVADSYTNIRNAGGKLEEISWKERFINRGKNIKFMLKLLKRKLLNLPDKLYERPILKERFHLSYLKGYEFHQAVVRKKPFLSNWILKRDYWEYKLPHETVNIS